MAGETYVPQHLADIPESARASICAAAKAAAANAPPLSTETKEDLRVLLRRPRPAGRSLRAA